MSRCFALFAGLILLSASSAYAQSAAPAPGASTIPGANPRPAPITSKAPPVDYFIGTWSTVSFNDEGDVGRMVQVARGYCNLPYKINRRSSDTFEMYVAEKLVEVKLLEQDNRVYIVPNTPEGQKIYGARELSVRDNNIFSLRYLENVNHVRYGQNVFVRCGKQAG